MQTIQAMVNTRLLSKADRLFTGGLQGRIIEILQNARRAGATAVSIENRDGRVIVNDNGNGIEDFSTLLDMGSSGWNDATEASEDPAGVGVFCLAPREVSIASRGKAVTIKGDGWTGAPVEVTDARIDRRGTRLEFEDESWTFDAVEPNAVFAGMDVIVDDKPCEQARFVSDKAIEHPELGCRIEVIEAQHTNKWHDHWRRDTGHGNVLVNFHGQVVSFQWRPVNDPALHYLVDMTGESTDIRLMLPARTRLVENEAFKQLKETLELDAYRFYQRRGWHKQGYQEYLRARELGIDLPEAKPTYTLVLLQEFDSPEPVGLSVLEDFPLAKCYRIRPEDRGNEILQANAHLLAALGKLDEPFVPVEIRAEYDGYSWAELPYIEKVEVSTGKELNREVIWCGELTCLGSLSAKVHTSNDKVWDSPVCMAIRETKRDPKDRWRDTEVLVTPEARTQLAPGHIMYHLGGFSDDGDTWDTQEYQFDKELQHFWDCLIGPDETCRRSLLDTLNRMGEWQQVLIQQDGTVTITQVNGTSKVITPPSNSEGNSAT